MKKMLVLFLLTINAFALEVDEKLTLRILKVSESGKTILINRGTEDGLVKGDHAKLFMTIGVVARAVMVKGSPTRSVWSVYRIVNADEIKQDKVLKLKITPAVKITKDESKTLVVDDKPSIVKGDPRDLGIPLADGADDLDAELSKENISSGGEIEVAKVDLSNKTGEIFSTLFLGSFDSTTTPNDNGTAFSSSESMTAFNFGYELYFADQTQWYSRISLYGQISITNLSVMSFEGSNSTENSTEFGAGFNFYPFTRPNISNEFIWFGAFDAMTGSTTTQIIPGDNATKQQESLNGTVTSFAIGAGVKFYTDNAIGARMRLDYYIRGDEFAPDSSNTIWIKNKQGPRITMGFSYRI